MKVLRLTREKLARLLAVLDRNEGCLSLRNLMRSYSIYGWEVTQAEELGWITIHTDKPAVGRPSRIAQKVSHPPAAKLPPYRDSLPDQIAWRHWCFVYAYLAGHSLCNATRAYQKLYPKARSYAGAKASASRLLRHPDVKAALAWIRAQTDRELPFEAKQRRPESREEIEAIFREHDHAFRLRQM